MPSRNAGSKRKTTTDPEVPAELANLEAQDRKGGASGVGQARSPVDAMHVEAPKKNQEKAQGHRRNRRK